MAKIGKSIIRQSSRATRGSAPVSFKEEDEFDDIQNDEDEEEENEEGSEDG